MITLKSYVCGRWHEGGGQGAVLVNPTTEEPMASCSSQGVDFAAAIAHARKVGGPALRALGFAGRAALLKALAGALHEHRDELIELGIANGGNTRGDAKFDIDGMIGTLGAYAHFGKGLGEGNHLPDGEGVQLGRTPRFWGQHIRVPLEGVAVHINAFNFPTWGMGEKMACALLAGLPVIEKPGTPTALLAFRAAEIIVESGVLPEGSFQFVAGSAGDLLDHMGPQDCLAFTGSSATGAYMRGHPNLVKHNVRVNVEADSVNAAILAPDVESGSDTYDLFLSNVALDMTQKAGQKCTAVRRILVPSERVEQVVEDLCAELSRAKVGDPSVRETRVGPLPGASQLADVRAGIERFAAHAKVACGGTDAVHEKGYFVAPTLLVAKDSETDLFHSEEVFGPVATVLAYDGSAEGATALANRGGGGLVASLYSDDGKWSQSVALGISPWHGRVWIGSKRMAAQSLPPGMVLPAMVHGGPGRAGGGEELGGLRGLEFYTQRTAIQGFQGQVAAAFGAAED